MSQAIRVITRVQDLDDVDPSELGNNELWRYDSASGLFKPVSLLAGAGITVTHNANDITVEASGGGGAIAAKEDGGSIVPAADTFDFKDFNIEDAGSNDAAIYHNLPSLCRGRLTTESGVWASITDRIAQGTVYWTPGGRGQEVSVYDATRWKIWGLSEISLALAGLTSGKNYDVFGYVDGGSLTFDIGTAWTSDTSRNLGVSLQNGVYVNASTFTSIIRSHSVPAGTGRLLGTLRTTGTGTTEDSDAARFLVNTENPVLRRVAKYDLTDTWTYNLSAIRQWRGQASNKVEFLIADPRGGVGDFDLVAIASGTTWWKGAVGIDSITAFTGRVIYIPDNSTALQSGVQIHHVMPTGYHYAALLEQSSSFATVTVYGDSGGTLLNGLEGWIYG